MEGEGESEIERARARKIERDGGRGGGVGVSNPVIFAGWQRFIVNPLNFEVTLWKEPYKNRDLIQKTKRKKKNIRTNKHQKILSKRAS